jgi:hypothetical protein
LKWISVLSSGVITWIFEKSPVFRFDVAVPPLANDFEYIIENGGIVAPTLNLPF